MTNRKLAKRGVWLMMIGFIFSVVQTFYFGSKMWAESTAEWICDILGFVVAMIGGVMLLVGVSRQAKQQIKDFKKEHNL